MMPPPRTHAEVARRHLRRCVVGKAGDVGSHGVGGRLAESHAGCGAKVAPLDEALGIIAARGPFDGVIGFSQGGAVACMVDAPWVVFFSTITTPPERTQRWGRPTLHVFDAAEEYVALCEEMVASAARAAPDATGRVAHDAGHNVPQDPASVKAVVKFVRGQLEL